MSTELYLLLITAVAIACLHTASGPDHYLLFIALSRSRGWSVSRTIFWTIICGCGHVWSSVLLALGGAAIGWSLSSITWLEEMRGGVAGWSILIFGAAYCIWGLFRANTNRRHKHFDVYDDGAVYVYQHRHGEAVAPAERHRVTPWVMFLIFVLGPCEPMIPLLYLPAVKASWLSMAVLVGVYTFFTLLTMVLIVVLCYYGFTLVNLNKAERYMHSLSGLAILICGMGMVFMGW